MAADLDANNINEIGRSFGLNADSRRELDATINRIKDTIGAHRAAIGNRFPRRDRNRALRRMSKALAGIEKEMAALAGHDGGTIPHIFAATLAYQLSNAGVELALGQNLAWASPSFRLLESRDATSRDGPYWALESEHYRPEREAILQTHASKVLQGHFRQIRLKLDAFLSLDIEHNKGGGKERPYRNYAVAVLAETFQPIFGEDPTSSPGGTFCQLCEYALPELGEDTEGLDSAILRTLRKMRR